MRLFTKSCQILAGIWTLSLILIKEQSSVDAILMPAIFFDPRNPLFDCPSRGINTIQVKMRDSINFHCPSVTGNLGTQPQTLNYFDYNEIMYIMGEDKLQDAMNCNATDQQYFLLRCNRPQDIVGVSVRFVPVNGDESVPVFNYGKTYYIIGTGNGKPTGLTNRVGGRCNTANPPPDQTFKMILKIRVCSYDETHVYKNCTVCKNIGCYTKGCGLYNEWQDWQYYRNISQMNIDSLSPGYTKDISEIAEENKCTRRRRRTCKDVERGCDGPDEEVEIVPCPVLKTKPNYQNCSSWMNVPGLYRNGTNSCFLRGYRNCSVGGLVKMTVSQWKMEETVCPITTAAPTTTPCKIPVCEEWTSSNETYKNSSGHCFMLYKRDCVLPIRSCQTFNVTERKLKSVACPLKPYVTSSIPMSSVPTPSATKRASSQTKDVNTNNIKPSKTIYHCTTLYTHLPCTKTVVSTSVTPITKVVVDGKWTGWGDCQSGKCKFKCRNCTNPAPQNNGKQCVGDWVKDMVCDDKKVDPNAGKREASTGDDAKKDVTSYVIPVVAALVGIICGAMAMHFIIRHKQRVNHRDYSEKLDPDTASCGTQETGMSNSNYKMDTLPKTTTPVA